MRIPPVPLGKSLPLLSGSSGFPSIFHISPSFTLAIAPHFQKQISQKMGIFWIPFVLIPFFSSMSLTPLTIGLREDAAATAPIVHLDIFKNLLLDVYTIISSFVY
jgi:hypothetical protein